MAPRRWFFPLVGLFLLASLVNYYASVPSIRVLYFQENESSPIASSKELNFTNAVHVVVSRFMQHQPDLLALGRARLKLFETICLQSLKYQDSNNFLWLILIDPKLHGELLQEMKRLVAPHESFFLVSTLDSNVRLKSVNASSVQSGNVDLLKRAAEATRSKLLVQTRLDADDGLARTALSGIRSLAIEQLENTPNNTEIGWTVYCIGGHLEWYPSTTEEAGTLIGIKPREPYCVTPGLSYAFAPGVDFSHLPTTKHHLLHQKVPTCVSLNQTACLQRTNTIKQPMAIRPRTATSGGMKGVGQDMSFKEASFQHRFWNMLESDFNVTRQSLVELHDYLNENVRAIVHDNLNGQCTKGHSCKESSKQRLQEMIGMNATTAKRMARVTYRH